MFKEINNGSTGGGQLQICAASPNKDLIQTLRTKLQFAQTSLEDMTRDRDRLKDVSMCLFLKWSRWGGGVVNSSLCTVVPDRKSVV